MKPIFYALLVLISINLQAQPLSYYLPNNVQYDPTIPTPASVIGHEVGQWHVTHDKLVMYMEAVAKASPRIQLQYLGNTYESRKQLALIVTHPDNHKNLENIRSQHIRWSQEAAAPSTNVDQMPVVMLLGHSIHGNESSGSNAALLTAYYLAAAQGPQIEQVLRNSVILLDPSFNPDGLNRFATWANMHKSSTLVTDPQAREFNEVWPGGRFNHYWFDLNRDWLPAQHVESRNRLKFFHDWKPNILTDHHEMGSNATFFFQPGVPSRVNPNTPARNQQLTAGIATFHGHSLDSIGSFYYTKEGYDDFYYGKGSTYPDIQGAIGILFEQASSRGHAQETDNGVLTFEFTIRNQFVTALSTIAAGVSMRKDLLQYQRDFFRDVEKEAAQYASKAFVFSEPKDKSRTQIFIDMLLRHQIQVFQVKQNLQADGKTFAAGESYLVPTQQPQFKLIKTIFEKTFDYKDSLFYDVTAWTVPLAFGLPYAGLTTGWEAAKGATVNAAEQPKGEVLGKSNYAYAFTWEDFYAPRLLHGLQNRGIQAKVASQILETTAANGQKLSLGYGSILIPVSGQSLSPDQLHKVLQEEVATTNIQIHAIHAGLSSKGIDLGSGSFLKVKKPSVLLMGGVGTSALDVGEIWHFLDTRMQIPVSIVDANRFRTILLNRYNVIIMPSGSYSDWDKPEFDKLRTWVSGGGTLIATEDATALLARQGITRVLFRNAEEKRDTTLNLPYYLRSDEIRAKDMTGSIFEAKMDLTHPIAWGYHRPEVAVFKSNTLFMDQNNNPYDSPVMYTEQPLLSGYMYRGYRNLIKQSAVINVDAVGRGRVISMVDNLNFRAFWLGTGKMFMNAVYFGDQIRL